ncbi:MAG TPA: VWA domain-containing protein [Blastocatellia bacterium]|nr:VWA domain-containing protein [Blastocatellia bacterium]
MYKAFGLIVALASTLFNLPANASLGQSPSRNADQAPIAEESVRLSADLVLVDVLPVQKKTGRIIGNLKPEDFTVFEDGVKQSVPYFSKEKLPVSIVVLVDRAGCVNPFSEQIRAATIKAIGHLKPEDEVAIMTFSNKVSLVQPFTRDRKLIADRIMSVEQQHRSEQHYFNAAIYEASEYMKRAANPGGRRAIIALTSLEASIDFSKISEKEALDSVLESGAVVSGILVRTVGGRIDQGIRGKPTSLLRHLGLRAGSLKMFVEETGGALVGAPPDQIDPTMNLLVDNISQSYSLAYSPTNTARDGKRRRIRVEISPEVEKHEGKTVLLARRSYVVAKDPMAKK